MGRRHSNLFDLMGLLARACGGRLTGQLFTVVGASIVCGVIEEELHAGLQDSVRPIMAANVEGAEQLKRELKFRNKILSMKVRSCGDKSVDEKLMDITLDESARGWIIGPFPTLVELSEVLGFEPI
eukprot:3783399-Amphidinium_carterae.1